MNRIVGIIESPTAPAMTNVVWVNKGVMNYFRNGTWVPLGEGAEGIKEIETKIDDLDKEMGEIKNDLIKFGSTQGVVELQIGDSAEVKAANLKVLQGVQSTDHTFFTDIDYGYGTGQWLPTVGGKATIFTSAGHMVCYNISGDGAVIKVSESENNVIFSVRNNVLNTITDYPLNNEELALFKTGKVEVIKIMDNQNLYPQAILNKVIGVESGSGTEMWTAAVVSTDPDGLVNVISREVTLYEGKLRYKEHFAFKQTASTLTSIASSSNLETVIAAVNNILSTLSNSMITVNNS